MKNLLNKLTKSLLTGLVIATSAISSVYALDTGTPLPTVLIESKGEIVLNNDKHTYQPWSTEQLKGKIRTIQHMAGRSSAKKINQPFIDALKQAKLNPENYQTTTIINVDDAVFATSSIVRKKAEGKKSEFPHSSIVVDEKGSALKPWSLSKDSSAIIILDERGHVLFFKDGALTPEEIKANIQLIQQRTGG